MKGIILAAAVGAQIIGGASAVDGDTLDVSGERVRLAGIDAPEANQPCYRNGHAWPCGHAAEDALATMLAGEQVKCRITTKDQYGRWIGFCSVNGVLLNRWLVLNGWAMDWPRYSDGRFADEQAKAKARGAGIWSGSFMKPWKWRWSH